MSIRDVLLKNAADDGPATGTPLEPKFRELFRCAVDQISAGWIAGTYDFLKNIHPAVNERIGDAENRLNNVWTQGRLGLAKVEDFEKALADWSAIHREATTLRVKEGAENGDQ